MKFLLHPTHFHPTDFTAAHKAGYSCGDHNDVQLMECGNRFDTCLDAFYHLVTTRFQALKMRCKLALLSQLLNVKQDAYETHIDNRSPKDQRVTHIPQALLTFLSYFVSGKLGHFLN